LYSTVRTSPQSRTNLFAGIETPRADTIKSAAAGVANVYPKIGGQHVDSIWFFKTSGDSLKFAGMGSADTVLNIYSLFATHKLYSDTQKVDSTWQAGLGWIRRYDRAVRDTTDTTEVRTLLANNTGRQNTYEDYRFAFVDTYRETAKYDTLFAPTIVSILPATGATGIQDTINGTYFYTNATVTYGGTPPSSYISRTSTRLICVVPAGTGAVNVIVTNQYGLAGTTTFTYAVSYHLDSLYRDTSIFSATAINSRQRQRTWGCTLQVDSVKPNGDTVKNYQHLAKSPAKIDTIKIRITGGMGLGEGNGQ
jgi:hypothetical protein